MEGWFRLALVGRQRYFSPASKLVVARGRITVAPPRLPLGTASIDGGLKAVELGQLIQGLDQDAVKEARDTTLYTYAQPGASASLPESLDRTSEQGTLDFLLAKSSSRHMTDG
jgi:hypothetical protein